MFEVLISIIGFLLAIGILITVHEYGHFWVARKLGVKVLRFSIGFGKPLWRYQKNPDEPEYVLAALPLGGYVKMLDEREGDVAPELRQQAFNAQAIWKRAAIVSAGPVFNLVLAILVYASVFMIGIQGIKPIIGEIDQQSLVYQSGLRYGDEITAIDNVKTPSWQVVRLAILESSLSQESILFSVQDQNENQATHNLSLKGVQLLKEEGDVLDKLGMKSWYPPVTPIIEDVEKDKAADRDGLQKGDKILKADNIDLTSVAQWIEIIRAHPEKPMELLLIRNGGELKLTVTPGIKEGNGKKYGYLGATNTIEITPEVEKMRVTTRYSFLESFQNGAGKTWDMTLMTFRLLGKLITGEASPRNISGPITIANYAGKSLMMDISVFLDFLAIISISLGVLNLLPIPLLDGGHLFYLLIESVKGSPVSDKLQALGQQLGLVILACLMTLAFYNDLLRLIG